MELGDLDDPMNAWHFGARDELFKYRLIGTHATMSGATCTREGVHACWGHAGHACCCVCVCTAALDAPTPHATCMQATPA